MVSCFISIEFICQAKISQGRVTELRVQYGTVPRRGSLDTKQCHQEQVYFVDAVEESD